MKKPALLFLLGLVVLAGCSLVRDGYDQGNTLLEPRARQAGTPPQPQHLTGWLRNEEEVAAARQEFVAAFNRSADKGSVGSYVHDNVTFLAPSGAWLQGADAMAKALAGGGALTMTPDPRFPVQIQNAIGATEVGAFTLGPAGANCGATPKPAGCISGRYTASWVMHRWAHEWLITLLRLDPQ